MLVKRLRSAIEAYTAQRDLYEALTQSLQAEHVAEWTAEIVAWEASPSHEDPYMVVHEGRFTRPVP